MAFVVQEQWTAGPRRPSRPASRRRVHSGAWHVARGRVVAIVATGLVHVALALMIALRLLNPDLPRPRPSRPGPAMTFDLAQVAPADPAPDSASSQAAASSAQPEAPPPLVRPEWAVVTIRVAAAANPPSVLKPLPTASAPLRGGGGFDPYAGSAPDRPGMGMAGAPASGSALMTPMGHLPPAFITAFKARHPAIHGLVIMRLDLDAAGRVSRVVSIDGSLRPSDRDTLRGEIGGVLLGAGATRGATVTLGPLVL